MRILEFWQIVIRPLTVVVVIAGSAAPLAASSLWATTWGGYLFDYKLNVFGIDVASGAVHSGNEIPGSKSRAGVRDFASDTIGSPTVVWSLNHTDVNGYELLSFNPHQQLLLSNVPLDDALQPQGLAIDPTTGLFYASSLTALYRVDPTTGQATLIGETTLRVDGALGFDLEGNLYGVRGAGGSQSPQALVRVNKLTGETTMVAEIDALPADIAVHPNGGVMYGLGFGNDPIRDYSLFTINLVTAEVADVGPSLIRPAGLAFTNIPEPTALTVALITIAVAAGWRCRDSSSRRFSRPTAVNWKKSPPAPAAL